MNSRPSFILTGPYEPDGRGGGKLIEFPNRKDDDMTIEELHAQTNAKIVEIIERIEVLEGLNDRVDSWSAALDSLAELVKANHALLVGRLDVMDQLNVSVNGKIEEVNENMVSLQQVVEFASGQGKRIEEMRGDVAICTNAIRDLDSIRDSATRAANQVAGFEPRLSQIEEAFAAFQTLRHDADSPRPDGALARSDGG